jgi:hypothetical protein
LRGSATHLDADVLAEFDAGLIAGHRAARIAAHLASCDRCTALSAQLAEVSAVLAAVPAPAMPGSVTRRLDAALASEVENRLDNAPASRSFSENNFYSERSDGGAASEPPTRHRRARFRLMTLRVLAPAAAVILAAAGYGLSRIGGGPASQGSTASSAGSSAVSAPASGRASAITPRQANAKPELMSPRRFALHVSHTDYRPATLRQQLVTELRTPAMAASTRTPSGKEVACVDLVTGDRSPVYVESASFDGQPATVIVVAQRSGDAAWVAGANCSGTDKDLLDRTTLPPGILPP